MSPAANLVDLTPLTDPGRVIFLPAGIDKPGALQRLIEITVKHPQLRDPTAFKRAIFEREAVSSTGIGGGIAVPHAKISSVDGFLISIGICPDGIHFEAKDGKPVCVLVMIAASDGARDVYLKVLATVATKLKQLHIAKAMSAATSPEEALHLFLRA